MITVIPENEILKPEIPQAVSDTALMEVVEEINRLKKEKNAIILVHNYIDPKLFHSVADITGDSLELSRRAAETESDIIVVCGVSFMAETVKLLNPAKKVLLPVVHSGCSLAASITAEDVRKLKQAYPGVPVVAYINTYADVKAEIDICCTSGNAEKIISSLPDKKIIFLPDEYLGTNMADKVGKKLIIPGYGKKEADIIGWDGHCEVHKQFTREQIDETRKRFPDALILSHPECSPEVVEASDFSGGTRDMINFIQASDGKEFCLLSESAMEKNIILNNPDKHFIPAPRIRCPHMAKITLENTLAALREEQYEIEIPETIRESAAKSVTRMLTLSK